MPRKVDGVWDEKVSNELELSYINKNLRATGWRILVETDNNIDGRWTIQSLQEDKTFKATRIQSYDTKKFWKYIDWYASGYTKDTFINFRFEEFKSVYTNEIPNSSIIKINNWYNICAAKIITFLMILEANHSILEWWVTTFLPD